jgi:DNA-binding response OmpR family regulator
MHALDPTDSARMEAPSGRARPVDRSWVARAGVLLLVVDPEHEAGDGLDAAFATTGLNTVWCRDGAQALVAFGRDRPDAVLAAPRLDVVDTPSVVRTMRDAGCHLILVGVGPDDVDLVGPALLAGASGAVARPYSVAEVTTRIQAEIHDIEDRFKLEYGPLALDPFAYRVRIGEEVVDDLPLKEFQLLRLLMTHADHVVTPEQIRCALWGDRSSGPSSNAVTVHVGRLRARLGELAELRTVRGLGYRLTV